MAMIARRFCRGLLSQPRGRTESVTAFSSSCPSVSSLDGFQEKLNLGLSSLDLDNDSVSDTQPELESKEKTVSQEREPAVYQEIGDAGIHKAILVGMVGQKPVQKPLKNGNKLTILTLGTGGLRSSRRPLENEDPSDYANRSAVLWHRVIVHQHNLGNLVVKNAEPGSILYVEGQIETKQYTDPINGILRRVREVVIRNYGRIVFLGKGNNSGLGSSEGKGAGYY